VLLEGVTLEVAPGDRVALLGRNGAGKSTCMKLLAGVLPPMAGTRTEARDLRIGYFAQHHLEQLKSGDSALDNLRRTGAERAARMGEADLRDYLARFGFRGDRVFEAIAPFSGGEKARLVLALVAFQRPNLLLLDEPTNHLDLEMRQALAVALQDYTGAVILVSHDRHLLNSIADEFLLVADGRATPFDGDLEDYARWLAARSTAASGVAAATVAAPLPPPVKAVPAAAAPTIASPVETAEQRRTRKRNEAEARNKVAPLRATVSESEQQLETLSRERVEVERQLESSELYLPAGKARLSALLQRQREIASEVQATEVRWLEAQEQLQAHFQ
jgi:ATP-binding cassette subfamily F protein 3